MEQRPTGKKILAMFVLAFLCFNAGGLLCLTYCSQSSMAAVRPALDDAHLSEHCRRAKKAAEEKDRNSTKFEAATASCCMMPISMFAVPLEKQTRTSDVMVVDAVTEVNTDFYAFRAPSVALAHVASSPVYRPPPLDRRNERILHSVFRI